MVPSLFWMFLASIMVMEQDSAQVQRESRVPDSSCVVYIKEENVDEVPAIEFTQHFTNKRTNPEVSEISNKKPCDSMANHRLKALQKAEVVSSDEEDEAAAFGVIVAAKLLKMNETQRLHAEYLMTQVLYKGMMKELSPKISDLFAEVIIRPTKS